MLRDGSEACVDNGKGARCHRGSTTGGSDVPQVQVDQPLCAVVSSILPLQIIRIIAGRGASNESLLFTAPTVRRKLFTSVCIFVCIIPHTETPTRKKIFNMIFNQVYLFNKSRFRITTGSFYNAVSTSKVEGIR